ncbi:MAG: TonB-dependent receptor plug domain-containing protein, partial [Saprospiraceae bacterium]|nr:TonB-dependent receptor plug domain-containing protein [Saprospiraceae bacterium]
MIRWIVVLVLIVCVGSMHGQTLRVVEKDTGIPLEWVTVQTILGDWNDITNSQGEVTLPALPLETILIFRRVGFTSIRYSIAELQAQDLLLLLEPTEYDLDQVVISAARRVQEKRYVSARIQTIQSEAIAMQNPQTTADLLGGAGEVFIQKSQQGGGSPMIRGFAANRLVYVVDGVRMNTAIFRSGNIQNIINIDPFSLERAEVLFGPGSVIYGSDAIGGVMSFQTLQPPLSNNSEAQISGRAVARYASANQEMTGHFRFGVGWENWGLVTSMSSWKFDHLRQGQNGPRDYLKPTYVRHKSGTDEVIRQDDLLLQIPSAYNQMNMMHKLRFMPNDQWDFTYGFHYSETSSYGRYDRHNRMINDLPRYAVWNYGPQKWMMNNLLVTNNHQWAGYDHMKIRIANQAFQESRVDRNFKDPQQRTRLEEVRVWSFNLDMDKQLGDNYSLFYGLEYVDNTVHSTGETENILTGERRPSSSRYPDAFWRSWAAYASAEYQPNRVLTLQGGMRLNRFSLDMSFLGNQDFYTLPFEEASND